MARGVKNYIPNKKLFDQAAQAVKAEQQASYLFFEQKFPGIGKSTTVLILKELLRRKIVRRGPKRTHVVIVNPDGTPKSEEELPPVRKYRSLKNTRKKSVAAPALAARTPSKREPPKGSHQEKLEVIALLTKASTGNAAHILKEIGDDLRLLEKHRKLLEALGG